MPPIVHVVPYKPSRVRRLIVRTCLIVWLAATLVYILIHLYPLVEGSRVPHAHPNSTHRTQLSLDQALLVDRVGNEIYASHYAERRISRFIIGTEAFLLACSMGLTATLAHRPEINRYIRIDEIGRAQAIAYSDLSYSPREGEIRTYLTDWANYRYTINRETVAKKYPLNYYFLSSTLASQMMTDDNNNHVVSQVLAGQVEQSEVEVKNVTITSMSNEVVAGSTLARGTALVNIDKLFSVRNSHEPRTEHWLLSVTYYLNPKQVSEQSRVFPQFETINPLGMTITEFHENRLSVDVIGAALGAEAQPNSPLITLFPARRTPGATH